MAKESYDESLRRLLISEGGYTNHPDDPGGPTNYGITIFDYRKYVKPDATALDVKRMKLEEAKQIYRAKYWDAQRCDDLPAGVDYSVFDYGVNSGIGRSGKVLRRVCGLKSDISKVDQFVLDAVRKRKSEDVIVAINDERLRFLKSLKTWRTFGAGWGRRVKEVLAYSLFLAKRKPAAEPSPPVSVMAKGEVPPPTAAKKAVVTTATGASAGTTGTVGATSQQHSGFVDWALANPEYVVLAVVATIAVIAISFRLINKWHQNKQEADVGGTIVVPEHIE